MRQWVKHDIGVLGRANVAMEINRVTADADQRRTRASERSQKINGRNRSEGGMDAPLSQVPLPKTAAAFGGGSQQSKSLLLQRRKSFHPRRR
jgi:hypothetical protein